MQNRAAGNNVLKALRKRADGAAVDRPEGTTRIQNLIKLIVQADILPEQCMSELLDEANQLCNIIGKSVVTAKANQTLGNRSSTSSHTET